MDKMSIPPDDLTRLKEDSRNWDQMSVSLNHPEIRNMTKKKQQKKQRVQWWDTFVGVAANARTCNNTCKHFCWLIYTADKPIWVNALSLVHKCAQHTHTQKIKSHTLSGMFGIPQHVIHPQELLRGFAMNHKCGGWACRSQKQTQWDRSTELFFPYL